MVGMVYIIRFETLLLLHDRHDRHDIHKLVWNTFNVMNDMMMSLEYMTKDMCNNNAIKTTTNN